MNPLFVEHLVRPLLDQPDLLKVQVLPEADSDKQIIKIFVASSDLQRVLGRQARVIKSLKTAIHILFPGVFRDIIVDVVA